MVNLAGLLTINYPIHSAAELNGEAPIRISSALQPHRPNAPQRNSCSPSCNSWRSQIIPVGNSSPAQQDTPRAAPRPDNSPPSKGAGSRAAWGLRAGITDTPPHQPSHIPPPVQAIAPFQGGWQQSCLGVACRHHRHSTALPTTYRSMIDDTHIILAPSDKSCNLIQLSLP